MHDIARWLRDQISADADVLAMCDAHAAILAVHYVDEKDPASECVGCLTTRWREPWAPNINECPTLRALALAYQHRPGYREEWRP
ncbi:hypothetical protein GCM10022243_48470 [Saccharothrix violaceirubra]|uniref:Uncharacterized protein n=1 Tax=Saccharothrix violaceirubra TaxID=413306 RepID=A0A7W7WU47_9PSEU|nr:DUF6221 family protein [Saccharothrix violaceirubra]MBB4963811.1 hypothetical protein [Saccharothrix violaceirubra]